MIKEIIAIDGPAASGKSSVAKKVAQKLNYKYIDSGSMYRCIALYALENNYNLNEIVEHLNEINIEFDTNNNVFLNKVNVTNKIRSNEVTNLVASVAALEKVREKLVALQQSYGIEKGIVMDGRDIGSVVFKDAKVKIYQVASVDARAKRRHLENLENNRESDLEEIKKEIEKRDYEDKNRLISPLTKADDAIELDTSNLSIDESVDKVIEIFRKKVHVNG